MDSFLSAPWQQTETWNPILKVNKLIYFILRSVSGVSHKLFLSWSISYVLLWRVSRENITSLTDLCSLTLVQRIFPVNKAQVEHIMPINADGHI